MEFRSIVMPLTAVTSVVLTTLGRFDERLATWAAFAGLALALLIVLVPDRVILVFAFLPAASFVAQMPPWGSLAQAIVLAGAIITLIGALPSFSWGAGAVLPLVAGAASAVLVGFVARDAGLMEGTGGALALLVVLVAFRSAAVFVGQTQWAYGLGAALATAPHLGVTGLWIAAVETGLGVFVAGSQPQHRVAWLFGAPFVAVGLFF